MSQDKGKNIVFVVGDSKTRYGTEENVQTIKSTFEKFYNATIYLELDRTLGEYKIYFSDLKRNPQWLDRFSKCDFVVIFCLAHGSSDGLAQFEGEVANYKALFLNPLFKIQQLNNKLKWFVLQSCRGELNDADIQFDNSEELKFYVKHHIISYCTGEGTSSYQYDHNGKVFIESICKQLRQNAEKENYDRCLLKMLQAVREEVKKFGDKLGKNAYSRPEINANIDSYKFQI